MTTVLVADDSQTIRTAVSFVFRNTEFEVLQADGVDKALQMISETPPAVILADANMPGRTGFELCRAVKDNPATAGIPVVLMGSVSSPFPEQQALDVGATGTLHKPFSSKDLLDLVRDTAQQGAAAPAVAPVAVAEEVAQVPVLEPPPQPVAATPAADVNVWAMADQPGQDEAIEEIEIDDMDGSFDVDVGGPTIAASADDVAAAMASATAAPSRDLTGAAVEQVAAQAQAALPTTDPAAISGVAREVVEQIAWEVVPELAEVIIREEIQRLMAAGA